MEIKTTNRKNLKKRLAISFGIGILFFSGLVFSFFEIKNDSEADETAAIIRHFFNFNESVFTSIPADRLSVSKTPPAKGTKPRINGDEGLTSELNLTNYQIEVSSGPLLLHISPLEIQKLTPTEVTTDFKCIEGWSSVIHYKGLRFSDFMEQFNLGKKPDGSFYRFVALETPDEGYYVSLDMKSMKHPQTVLAYEMNGEPLSVKNGAPLRLIIPIKYGVKSLKRIGRIYFSDEVPKDFWTEQGYDWYSGL
jgi:DMSO/TMAO reductase YedYZ molybdopterin-dependent catalytic subunit